MKSPILSCAMVLTLSLGALSIVYADSATWSSNPVTSDWNTAANWAPPTVPNRPSDTATFATSNTTEVSFSATVEVNGIVFSPAASAFAFTVPATLSLNLSGVGVTNNSGIVQQFIAPADDAGGAGAITFTHAAIAGELTTYTNPGGTDGGAGGAVTFMDNASAAGGTFINHGSLSSNALGGITGFFGHSSAGNGTFIQNGSAVIFGRGGQTDFHNASTAASGTFTLNGGTGSSGFGGLVQFFDTATAANAMFTVNGGETAGVFEGELAFLGTSTADNCTILANGTDVPGAAGAFILFAAGAAANAGNATVIINGGATAGALLSSPDVPTAARHGSRFSTMEPSTSAFTIRPASQSARSKEMAKSCLAVGNSQLARTT